MLLFLAVALLGANPTDLFHKTPNGPEIDLLTTETGRELKTKNRVAIADVSAYIDEYYREMVASQDLKPIRWLIFFLRRTDAKAQIGKECLYYLVNIEIQATNLRTSAKCQSMLTSEVLTLVEKAEKQVLHEDEVETGIFAPVSNYIVVDRLRKEKRKALKERDKTLATLAEKDSIIAEKETELAEKDKIIKKLQDELDRKQNNV